jgi:OmpA-OmpF porin, OOP family
MKKTNYFAASLLAVSMLCSGANAQVNQDVVVNDKINIVINDFGNCVRTKWQAEGDACAATVPAPAPVAAPIPAPVPDQISSDARTVYFEFDKANLTPEARAKLDSLVTHISGSQTIVGAGIAGYADKFGSSDYNMALSKKRAKAVYDYLSQRVRINTQILDIRALGNSAASTQCAGEKTRLAKIACMATDRRVEVEFEYKK